MNIQLETMLWYFAFAGIIVSTLLSIILLMRNPLSHQRFLRIIFSALLLFFLVTPKILTKTYYDNPAMKPSLIDEESQNTYQDSDLDSYQESDQDSYLDSYEELKKKFDFLRDDSLKLNNDHPFYYTAEDGNQYIVYFSDDEAIISDIRVRNRSISIPGVVEYEDNLIPVEGVLLDLIDDPVETIVIPNTAQIININILNCDDLRVIQFDDINNQDVGMISLRIDSCFSLSEIIFPNNRVFINRFSVEQCPMLQLVEMSPQSVIDEEAIYFHPDSLNEVQIICDNPDILNMFYY